jgi:Zn-dependent peptidase ImmA (M78 family)
MTKVYRRSLLVFYLDHPPEKGDRGQDFRTAPGSEPPLYNPVLDALIRDIRGRQGIIKSLREDAETEKLPFIGSANMNLPADSLAGRIIQEIDFSLKEFRAQSSIEDAFTYLRSKIEESGTFVLLLGNLGSHHTDISVDTFRGYAIADEIAPVVVVNDHDARSAWSFTALHEVAHLWLGTTGISGFWPELRIERYCNDVAAEILLPSREHDDLARLRLKSPTQLIDDVSAFAKARRISRAMVAYRLFQLGVIDPATWKQLTKHFRKAWLASKERDALKDERGGGGPNYYVVRRHRLGKALLGLVSRSLGEGLLTPTKAGLLLGVKPRNVDPLIFGDTSARGGR